VILITRIDNKKVVINGELVEMIEQTPETLITLTTGKKLVVKETVDEIVDKIKRYKQELNLPIVKDTENQNL
jgi:flagellar protein FlbD